MELRALQINFTDDKIVISSPKERYPGDKALRKGPHHYEASWLRKENHMEPSLIPQVKELTMTGENAQKTVPCSKKITGDLAEEAYRLQITPSGIQLEGGSEKALRYALQTLNQIAGQCGEAIPCLFIQDSPSFPHRSFHIDCARHFFPIGELKKMIGMAACFKFSHFHWHISDDQGWRIESKAYPLLHQIGSVRRGDHFGCYSCDEEEGGYYTREQVTELVSYCEQLGIEVVPEIDMPGHVSAILAAYPELSCTGDKVEVGMKGGIFRDILCPGKEETFTFIEKLLDDMLELFPGEYFHIGGDEAPKVRWKVCPHCQRRMRDNGLETVQQLQGYMLNRAAEYLRKKGRKAIVWNEASNGGNLDPDITIQLWTDDQEGTVIQHMEKGGKVILSHAMNSYCDYPYGYISLKSLYDIELTAQNYPKQAVIGNECLIWTEYIRTCERLEELSWPRFSAAAEAGWCGAQREGYDSFSRRLRELFFLFEENGISATEERGWVPSEEEAAVQYAQFQKNFPESELEEVRKAQEEV